MNRPKLPKVERREEEGESIAEKKSEKEDQTGRNYELLRLVFGGSGRPLSLT